MIKINFLQEESVQAVASEPAAVGLPPARQTAIFLASLVGVCSNGLVVLVLEQAA
jgi:hypothetical protein